MLHKPQRQPFCHLIGALLLLTCGLVLFRVGMINYTNHISNKVIVLPIESAYCVTLFLSSTSLFSLFRVLHAIHLLRVVPITRAKKDGTRISTERLYSSFSKTNPSIQRTTATIGSHHLALPATKENLLFHYLDSLKKINLAIVFSGDFR